MKIALQFILKRRVRKRVPPGFLAFFVVWVGQLFSLTGIAMTNFVLGIWAWQVTGQATALALVGFFNLGPMILFSPIAGVLVDRLSRKLTMMASDFAAGLVALVLLLLFLKGNLQIWHLYALGAFSGIAQAFQFPAYSAAISTMVTKEHYARASGMLSLAQSSSQVVAPLLGAVLLTSFDLSLILIIEILTILVAIGTLLAARIPPLVKTPSEKKVRPNLWKEAIFGFHYIFQRPSLLGLQLIFFALNFIASFALILRAPMVLALTNNDSVTLGTVQSAAGIGGLTGGSLLAIWGGPKRKIKGVLLGMILVGIVGISLMGIGRNFYLWIASSFFFLFLLPIVNGCSQAIWQSKIPHDIQGRVFATRVLIAQLSIPLAMITAGPLADKVFEPALMPGGALVSIFGPLVGVGLGSGMSLMFFFAGLLTSCVGAIGFLFPSIREVERLLPDFKAD